MRWVRSSSKWERIGNKMKIRMSIRKDAKRIMEIIGQAQEYFKSMNIDQWQKGYPNLELIYDDIKKDCSYVLEDETRILATAAISFDGEPTYQKIYEGAWLSDYDYAVIHRIAVDNTIKSKGMASMMVIKTEDLCRARKIHSVKVDTHRENLAMQNMLLKNDFHYCGIILLSDGEERLAYEKLLD